jgi:AmmeMemoRadiSam system protein B
MLAFIEAGDADGFFEFVRKEEDRRKICGLTAIYVTLAACEAAGARAKGRLLHYAQSPEEETQSLVSYAAVALE